MPSPAAENIILRDVAVVLDFGGSWDVYLPLVEFSYNNSYHSSVRCAPFEALYGRKCRSPIMWAEVVEGHLIGLKLVQETTEKISQIKNRLKAARDRQKSCTDKRRKPLEFSVGEYVLLKVSPWKGVVHFGKKGKLAPRFVGPFEIIERISPVAYRLRLLEELNGVHDTFHVSNFKKCLADPTLQVPLDEIQVDAKLNFVEELMKILEREFKKHKRSTIAIVKLVEVVDDVNSLNKEGGSLAAIENVNLDAGYDSGFEDGSSKEPNVSRGRRNKKSKKDSELGELEETMKSEIANITAQENQGPTMEECHEKLKRMRLEPDDLIYLAALGIFCQSKSYKEACVLLLLVSNVLKKWIEMMACQLGF
ncbi:putative reverse transcriptase domain-containing protein [Tanacetum coccineum]